MSYQLTKTEQGEAQIKVAISAAALKAESSWAAARLSKDLKIPGFRPGKIPYDVVKRELGEAKILEEAADKLVTAKLNEIIKKENLEIASQPKIEVKKLAAGNDLIFSAIIPIIPKVTLPNFSKIKVKKPEIKIESEKIDQALNQLRQLRAKEIRVSRPAAKGDKVEVDFEVKVAGKIIGDGKVKKYSVILGQNQIIPDFENQIIGLKENQEKEFEFNFPKNHPDHLASKRAELKVKVQAVFKLELPEPNDEFAKSCGAKNVDDLKQKINDNIKKEAEKKAREKEETEIIEKATQTAKFGIIPNSLIKNEQRQMLHELETQITQSGGKFDDYLKHIKKSREELKQGFYDNAKKRVRTQLLFRKIILDNHLEPKKEEIDTEIKKAEAIYASSPEIIEKIKSNDYRHYIEMLNLNRQVVNWLKHQVSEH